MKIAVSACLLGYDVKYNGGNNRNEKLIALLEGQEVIPVCPEVWGGLGVPRDPAERQNGKVISCRGRDVTEEYMSGTALCMEKIRQEHAGMAVLKARSPACGKDGIYDGTFSHTLRDGDGTLAEAVKNEGIPLFSENEYEMIRRCISGAGGQSDDKI
jgi:uncharacterized protein YbbK (DUF523 family)